MSPTLALPPAEPAIECTDKEKAGLEKLASIKMRAEAGDRQAKIQWIAVASKFRATKARAKAGDPKARRSLAILQQAGFLQPTQKFSFSSGEQASFDDAWGQAKKYGSAVEKKDAKTARDSIEWMILRGWKASGSAGSFPFYSKITWSHASLPGKKIAFSTTGSAYAVAIVSGEVGPRKAWADSEPVPQGARKAWADDEPAPKLPPHKAWADDEPTPKLPPHGDARPLAVPLLRKSWIDDEIPTLTRRAKAGDISAQIALRKIALRKSADDEEMSLGDDCMGEGSSFIGDSIPHDTYRAAVMLTAIKNANGSRPTTKDIFAAKTTVDNKLGNMGVSIYLPGARPARRTY
jgi:hypothetical protein